MGGVRGSVPIWISSPFALVGAAMLVWAGASDNRLSTSPVQRSSRSAAGANNLSIGTNLDGIAYWSSALPFLDLMKSSGDWFVQAEGRWDTGEFVPVDEQGWPTAIPKATDASTRSIGLIALREAGDAATPRSRYVVRFDGSGDIDGMKGQGTRTVSRPGAGKLVVAAGDNGWLQFAILSTDPHARGDNLRNVRIVRQDLLHLYDSGALFNPAFLSKIEPFRTFRFMDWMATNELRDANDAEVKWHSGKGVDVTHVRQLEWHQRPKPDDARWNRGVPVEVMVDLLNQTGADGWFNMPVNASDDYVRSFASYVRNHLDPKLKVHVEVSNEVWNWGFPQAHYAELLAKREFGPDAKWMEWYGKRTAEVGMIWSAVFGESPTKKGGRVRIVYNTQLVYKGLETSGLETPHWRSSEGRSLRAADYFDEYAIAGYYEAGMSTDKQAPGVMRWWTDADGGFSRAIAALRDGIEENNAPLYAYHAERAAEYGLDLVTYEGGFGERTPPSQHANQHYTDFLMALQRRPEIYDLELANAAAFRRAGGTLLMNFGIVGKPSKWGSWSALESVNQDSSPRYRALVELAGKSREVSK